MVFRLVLAGVTEDKEDWRYDLLQENLARLRAATDAQGRALRVLPSVAGRPEKGRRPEAPEYRLDTGPSAAFQGGFAVALLSPEKK